MFYVKAECREVVHNQLKIISHSKTEHYILANIDLLQLTY